MLPPNHTSDQWHDFLKLLVKPFGASLPTIDCPECETLLAGWLAGDVPTREICAHLRECPATGARLELARAFVDEQKAIPVEIPMMIGVEA